MSGSWYSIYVRRGALLCQIERRSSYQRKSSIQSWFKLYIKKAPPFVERLRHKVKGLQISSVNTVLVYNCRKQAPRLAIKTYISTRAMDRLAWRLLSLLLLRRRRVRVCSEWRTSCRPSRGRYQYMQCQPCYAAAIMRVCHYAESGWILEVDLLLLILWWARSIRRPCSISPLEIYRRTSSFSGS